MQFMVSFRFEYTISLNSNKNYNNFRFFSNKKSKIERRNCVIAIKSSLILSLETLDLMPEHYCPKYDFSANIEANNWFVFITLSFEVLLYWLRNRQRIKEQRIVSNFAFICQSSTRNNTGTSN